VFQLNAFQRNAFEIGYTKPSGGYVHEIALAAKRKKEREERERLEALQALETGQTVVDNDQIEAQTPAKQEQANRPQNRPEEYDNREFVEQILLLEYHILDSKERKRLSQNLALCLLLLSE